jgi:membrane protein implicated in regulation of membrane protease activity
MYLAAVPTHGSLLSVLGPWPWYILSAAAVALVLLLILDAPFHRRRLVRSKWAGSRERTRSDANRETAEEKDAAGKNGSNDNP